MPGWMEPFRRTIDAAKKYVVSSTLDRVDWNAELVRGDLGTAVQQLKQALAQHCAKNTAGGAERADVSAPRAAGQPRLIALRNRRICACFPRRAAPSLTFLSHVY